MLILFCGFLLSSMSLANDHDPLIGIWKTIDEHTGYSLADVHIRKDRKTQQYAAIIIQTRGLPGSPAPENCQKCQATQKNQPLIGLEILSGLRANTADEYHRGQLLSPNDGQHYRIRARLINHGKHLILYRSSHLSSAYRPLTWVKID